MLRDALMLIAAAGLLLAGCADAGPTRAQVSGTVKLNGELVKEGAINFFPVDASAGPEAGAAIADGKFLIPRAQGPVVGNNRVELRAFQKSGRKIQDPTAPAGTLTDEIANIFPPEYNANSTLVREVKDAENVFDFEITTKPGN